ncbi:hypothetical protein GGQ84_002554 [Desulfitispora alkaliphila]|uniref:hypothetical protein n=1 Tax=Desulfitispora alkaliphila TaxID=622674 RepID=UPI003D256E23
MNIKNAITFGVLMVLALLEYYITWQINWTYYKGVIIIQTHFVALVIIQVLHGYSLFKNKPKITTKTVIKLVATYCIIPLFFIIQLPDITYNEAKIMVALNCNSKLN